MHVNLEQKKIYYNIDIHKSKLFESQRFVYKRMHKRKNDFVNM